MTTSKPNQQSDKSDATKNTNEMYVLYADIMGFKDRVMRTEHNKLRGQFEQLINAIDRWLNPNKKPKTFQYSFFSDSILIVDEPTKEGFNHISQAAAGLMHVALKHGFPIKGAIAKGKFTYDSDKSLFFGQAIIDAYLLQEQIHYYGIVAHHTMDKDIEDYANGWNDGNGKRKRNPYVLSPIPLKSGSIKHYHLAYNLISLTRQTGVGVDNTTEVLTKHLIQIQGTVSGAPRIYIDKTLQVLKKDRDAFRDALNKKNPEGSNETNTTELTEETNTIKIEFPLSDE